MELKSHHLLPDLNPDSFYLSGSNLTEVVLEKRPLNACSTSNVGTCYLRDEADSVVSGRDSWRRHRRPRSTRSSVVPHPAAYWAQDLREVTGLEKKRCRSSSCCMLVTELERQGHRTREISVVPRPAACWSQISREKVTGLERKRCRSSSCRVLVTELEREKVTGLERLVSLLVLLRAGHRIRLNAVAEDATQSIPAAAPQLHGNRQHRPTVQCYKGSEDLPS